MTPAQRSAHERAEREESRRRAPPETSRVAIPAGSDVVVHLPPATMNRSRHQEMRMAMTTMSIALPLQECRQVEDFDPLTEQLEAEAGRPQGGGLAEGLAAALPSIAAVLGGMIQAAQAKAAQPEGGAVPTPRDEPMPNSECPQ